MAEDADELDDDDELVGVVVPETTGLAVVADVLAMFVSFHRDIDAAAGAEHAAIRAAGRGCRRRSVLAHDQALRIAAIGLAAAVLAGGRLIAQRELQSAAVGLQSGVVQRLLQLRGVLLQHGQGFRLFDCQMRRHLAA